MACCLSLSLALSLSLSVFYQELWMEYLKVHCSDLPLKSATPPQDGRSSSGEGGGESQAPPPTGSSTMEPKDKGQLFYKAMTSSNSYAVGLEVSGCGLLTQ